MVDTDVSKRLWDIANKLWANTGLRHSQFSAPVLGLIFLRYAERIFKAIEDDIGLVGGGGRRVITIEDYKARKSYLPACYGSLGSFTEPS